MPLNTAVCHQISTAEEPGSRWSSLRPGSEERRLSPSYVHRFADFLSDLGHPSSEGIYALLSPQANHLDCRCAALAGENGRAQKR
jgi:hypothetical protein